MNRVKTIVAVAVVAAIAAIAAHHYGWQFQWPVRRGGGRTPAPREDGLP